MTARVTPRGERIAIRRTNRGGGGFMVTGSGSNGFGTRILTHTRTSAEVMRDKLYAGQEIELEDFYLE